MHLGQHVDLLVLLVQQVLEFADLALELPHALLERLGVSTWEGAAAQLVAGAALEADAGALRAAGSDAIAANLLATAAVAGLSNPALGAGAHLDNFHGEDAGHLDGVDSAGVDFENGARQVLELGVVSVFPLLTEVAAVVLTADRRSGTVLGDEGCRGRVQVWRTGGSRPATNRWSTRS
jgi:hypothetical protein